jgi:two-component system, NtrC family, nitrogen regulation sensor histidine kinase NtrY
MPRWSLRGRAAVALAVCAVAVAALTATAMQWLPPLTAALAALIAVIPLLAWLVRRITRPWVHVVQALRDGILSLRDHDFSISVGATGDGELNALADAYNSLGDLLRRERLDLYQRELLLDTVIQSSPLSLVLTDAGERVVYSNVAARELLHGGRKLEGLDFTGVLADAPPPLREALAAGGDTLFTMEVGGEAQVYHFSQRAFRLNARPHRLVLLKQLTRELAAQEVAVWKRVIRVIAHELNNSLAPINSLAHSGRLLTQAPDTAQLTRVFDTIGERAAHLATFIDGYARFAKLPRPRPSTVSWSQFLARLEGTMPFRFDGPAPEGVASFDASQLQQVMINLLKNAAESGSAPEEITVSVRPAGSGFRLEVADRGAGLSEGALRDALLPFYSTKATGTGLGLTLCREIIEAHGGRLSLTNRQGGGALVTVWLPQEQREPRLAPP